MKKILFTLLTALVMLVAFNGCSKKAADNLIGRWKLASEMPGVEIIYEFTPTNMNIEVKVPNQEHKKIEITYTIKSDDGTTVVIEVIHPVTKQKGEFKITITDKKMKMIDPDGGTTDLTKM